MVPSLLLSRRTICWKLCRSKTIRNGIKFVWKNRRSLQCYRMGHHDSAMVPLISCKADMSSWLKAKYPGSGASGIRGRPGEMTSGSFGKSLKLHLFSRVAKITFDNIEGTRQTRMKKKMTSTFKLIFAQPQVTHMEIGIKPHYANFYCLQLYNRIILM